MQQCEKMYLMVCVSREDQISLHNLAVRTVSWRGALWITKDIQSSFKLMVKNMHECASLSESLLCTYCKKKNSICMGIPRKGYNYKTQPSLGTANI